ncbi:sulfate/molybdate ABC transporter ATP-binding protein [Nocardia mexicana]|uniref:Molybdate transport system ATP-binding protein n=1 Tax=Nocardia mexicana TaxID=279262 RepID=A0A370GX88_9NOCA|nr:ATP-binding cassette domain-containing protein [Nocardia mexicana]RDI48295.1 molybdate transport system ATP-binding protein [Nocardia mexicana]
MTSHRAEASAGLEVSVRVAERGLEVELSVGPGEVLAVLGPNGAGKSTLLEAVAGLVRPDDGWIRLDGRELTVTAKGVAAPPHRREVSLLAQDPLLFPHLSAVANVAFGPRSRGMRPGAAREVARDWLAAVDAAELGERRPGELSGGQAQRVALARALAVEPRVVLLDEPMAALDVTAAPAMRSLLRRVLRADIRKTVRTSTILITHDIVDALTLADRVVVLESGRIVEQGPVAAVLSRPRSAFAARIAGVNLMVGTAVADENGTGVHAQSVSHSQNVAGPHADSDAGSVPSAGSELPPGPDSVLVETVPREVRPVSSALGSAASARPDGRQLTGAVRCGDEIVHGCRGDGWSPGAAAAAVFSPAAVAVHRDHPTGSPRNVFRVRIAELTDRGGIVRVHAADGPGGTPGPVADLTPASVAELDLAPGAEVYFAVKTTEVQVYPC